MVKKQPTEKELLKEINKLLKENPALAHSFIRLQRALVSIFSTSNIKKLLLELLTKFDSPIDIQELTKNRSDKTRQYNRKTDWSKSSDNSLRAAYKYRINNNQSIDDELNQELAKRFPTYDPDNQIFTYRRKTDWSKSSDACLRNLCYSRKYNNKPIDDDLNAELAKRFPKYDPIKREFVKKSNKASGSASNKESKTRFRTSKPKTYRRTTDWSKSSDNSLRVVFTRRKKGNKPIEDDLNEELAKRFETYDPVNRTFPTKAPKNWSTASDAELRNALQRRNRSHKQIEDDLNAELAKRFPTYSAERRTFIGRMPRRKKRPTISSVVYKKAPVLQIVPEQKTVSEQKTEENDVKTKIKITTKFVKYDLDGKATYNDVYINGKRVLKNHINTEIKLFFDDTLLAIHGIVTDHKNYPLSPVWLLYDTNLKKLIPENKQTFNNYFSVARNIFIMPDGKTLRADLDFRNTSYLYMKEKLKRIANGKYFSYEK